MDEMDVDSAEASEDEMSMLVKFEEHDAMTPEAKAEALPWTIAEELVAGHLALAAASPASASLRVLRSALAVLVLSSLALPMMRHANSAPLGQKEGGDVAKFVV